MKHIIILFLTGLLITIPMGCNWDDPIDNNNRNIVGSGPIVTKTLTLDDFSKIENTGVADIHVTVGGPQSVVLKAQQNIIDVMTIGVLADELKIGLEQGVSIERADTIVFNITVPEISSITLTGVGTYVLSGDYQDELAISITGVGDVKAFGLEVGTCTISITGVGDCEVFVKNKLDISILGVGDVYWKGNPDIASSISGVGNLIDAN
jgi:hypothetical protein